MSDTNRNRAFYLSAILLILLCAFACGWLQYLTPWQRDDLYYGRYGKFAMIADESGITWPIGKYFFKMHYATVNGRLGDKLILWVITWMPKRLIGAVSGLSCLSLFYFGSRLAFGSVRRHPLRTIMLVAALNCLLPWFCGIFITNIALNYLWGSALAVIVMWLFVRPPERQGALLWVGLFLLSLIAAWWHEAYSVAFLPGMLLFALLMRRRLKGSTVAILAGTFAGVVIVLVAPGFWVRVGGEIYRTPLPLMLRGAAIGLGLTWLVPLLLLTPLRRRLDRLSLAAGAMVCVALGDILAIFFMSIYAVRMFWYVDVIALPVAAMLCVPLIGRVNAKLRVWSCVALSAFLVVHYAVTIPVQAREDREYKEVSMKYMDSADGVVYYDCGGWDSGPWISLHKCGIFAMLPEDRCNSNYMVEFYRVDGKPLSLVPTSLRDFDMRNFSAGKQTISYRGAIVSRDAELAPMRSQLVFRKFRDKGGKSRLIPLIVNPFKASDGTELYYLEPDTRQGDPAQMTLQE